MSIEWKTSRGVHVDDAGVERLAASALRLSNEGERSIAYASTGEAMVLVIPHGDGTAEVFHCIVRREAVVRCR